MVSLEGIGFDKTIIQWNFIKSFKSHTRFVELTLNTTMPFSVQGNNEVFTVIITNNSIIQDFAGNLLINTRFQIPAVRYLILTEGVQTVGNLFVIIGYLGLIITMGLSSFKSSTEFWAFLSTLQILSYLPLIDCTIPSNMKSFFTDYFGVSKSSIPFDSLPGWINPLNLLAFFKGEPYNERFNELGYKSLSVIYNFSNQIGTWLTALLTFLVASLASKLFTGFMYFCLLIDRGKIAKDLRDGYKFNGTLRLFLMSFMHMMFCAILNAWLVTIYFNK